MYVEPIATFCSLIVGLIFLLTGIAKIIAPWKFIQHIARLQLLPGIWSYRAALLFIGIECALGVALIFAVLPSLTLPASILLLSGFSILTYWSTSTGRTEDCGCYNGTLDVSPVQSLLLNGLYILLLAVALTLNPWGKTLLWQEMLVAATFATSYGLAGGSFSYRSTNGHPFIDLGLLQADRPWKPEWFPEEVNEAINPDSSIIVFMSTTCPHCKQWLDVLKVVHDRPDLPDVLGILALSDKTTPEKAQEFVDSCDLNFPVGGVTEKTYNKLDIMGVPTAVLLEGGIIQEIWTGGMSEEFIDRIKAGDLSYPISADAGEEALEELERNASLSVEAAV